jgi:hypothetical protein
MSKKKKEEGKKNPPGFRYDFGKKEKKKLFWPLFTKFHLEWMI